MKLQHYISKTIQEYPTLFKGITYKKSRLNVLEQTFLSLGNEVELAHTKEEKKGGYYTETQCRKYAGKYQRIYDKPYGKETYKQIPDDYFKKPIFEEILNIYDNTTHKVELKVDYDFIPYPLSTVSNLHILYTKNHFIQDDWLQGAIDLAKRVIEFYENFNQYAQYSMNYPKELKAVPTERGEIIKALRSFRNKNPEHDIFQGLPKKEPFDIDKQLNIFEDYRSETLDFMYRFIERYSRNI